MKSWPTAPEANSEKERRRAPWSACFDRLKEEIRVRQYSRKTWQAYAGWVGQFQSFLGDKDPATVTRDDARRFLTHLAVERRVVATTQNQAFNSLLFFYRHVLKVPYELGDTVKGAAKEFVWPWFYTHTVQSRTLTELARPLDLDPARLRFSGSDKAPR